MNSDLADRLFGKLFYLPEEQLIEPTIIMVNLNSLISPTFYKSLSDEFRVTKESAIILTQSIFNTFKAQMIERYSNMKCIFYYKDIYKPYVSRSIYKYWRKVDAKDDDSEFGRMVYDTFDKAINALAGINQVRVVKTDYDEHTFIPRLLIGDEKINSSITIFSRDPMDLINCIYANVEVWNGRYRYSQSTVKEMEIGKAIEYGSIPPYIMSWVLLLAGAKTKVGYPGIPGYGIKTALKFLKNNLQIIHMTTDEIMADINIPDEIKNVIKYKPLFFYSDYVNEKERLIKDGVLSYYKTKE